MSVCVLRARGNRAVWHMGGKKEKVVGPVDVGE